MKILNTTLILLTYFWFILKLTIIGHLTILKKIIQTHKRLISWYQRKLRLSDYALLWFVFFKGFFLAIIINYILF